MNRTVYFAYGSNMSQRRFQARVPSAEFLGLGTLANHALTFHKLSTKDGSGKCGIVPSAHATVYGALFKIAAAELPALDAHEGIGKGYERRTVRVQDSSGKYVEAWTYVATQINPGLRPFAWYKRHVLEGAREAKLPLGYLRLIEATEAIEDPDAERRSRELAIYDE
jgi:gamma-glutamylcyclotransferase (GGCT)/AIG2-like uncharacterized protein YtfP